MNLLGVLNIATWESSLQHCPHCTGAVFHYITCLVWTQELSFPILLAQFGHRSCLPLDTCRGRTQELSSTRCLQSLNTGAFFHQTLEESVHRSCLPLDTCRVCIKELSSTRHLQSQDTGAVFHQILAESGHRSCLPLDTCRVRTQELSSTIDTCRV